jgi:hypothetical protein
MPDDPEQPPAHWPEGVFPLYIEEFQKLGRDKKNALFWDGKPFVTKNQYVFTGYQIFLSILAIIASIATISTGTNNLSLFLCARGVNLLGCPVVTPNQSTKIIVEVTEDGKPVSIETLPSGQGSRP